jgi:hypothetical protein
MLGKRLLTSIAAGMLMAAAGTAGAAANFDADVATSIDKGLAWLDSQNCYGGAGGTTFSCGDATGLALLALLEKRPAADADSQGYSDASDADKARMRRTVRYIINSINGQSTFASYRDGAYMMALSVYMRTGGPDKDDGPTTELDGAPLTLKQAVDKVFDRSIAAQLKGLPDAAAPWPASNGYWYYYNVGTNPTPGDYRDSSTTQLVVAGLAAARGVYIAGTYADAARATQLDQATVLARTAYEKNGTAGGNCTADPQPSNEKGHGYNAGEIGSYYTNSSQQTASGLWIQLAGGSSLNNSNVQGYLRWLRHRYRYTDILTGGVGTTTYFGDYSYWYYLWSSFKAYQFLADSKAVPAAGNIGVADIGTLPAASAPACTARQVHLDPTAVPRIAQFGAGAAGYYGDETPRVYFDYAYTIMGYQCSSGFYGCGSPSRWDSWAEQAYALLVLQRSVGGGCLDSDRDGICNSSDDVIIEPPPSGGGLYCDQPTDNNAIVDLADTLAIGKILGGQLSVQVTPATLWANYVTDSVISRADYEACYKVLAKRPGFPPKSY